MGTVLSVYNFKGGMGKTTILANLASAAAIDGKKVLMVDCDPQCNLTDLFSPPHHKLPCNEEDDEDVNQQLPQHVNSALAKKLFKEVSTLRRVLKLVARSFCC